MQCKSERCVSVAPCHSTLGTQIALHESALELVLSSKHTVGTEIIADPEKCFQELSLKNY